MEFVGRITKQAILRTIKKNNRSVVSFTVAINDYYKPKDADKGTKLTTYIDCAYWVNPNIAQYLTQGTLVEVHGRLYASAYLSKNNEPKASMNCHVSVIKIHASGKFQAAHTSNEQESKEDLPF